MNEETFNQSLRQFLKSVGVRSQLDIEKAVTAAIAAGQLKGNETLPASARITVAGIALDVTIEGTLKLE
ncbi:MAG: DUF6494 family protein [Burkholderiales bacterium]